MFCHIVSLLTVLCLQQVPSPWSKGCHTDLAVTRPEPVRAVLLDCRSVNGRRGFALPLLQPSETETNEGVSPVFLLSLAKDSGLIFRVVLVQQSEGTAGGTCRVPGTKEGRGSRSYRTDGRSGATEGSSRAG